MEGEALAVHLPGHSSDTLTGEPSLACIPFRYEELPNRTSLSCKVRLRSGLDAWLTICSLLWHGHHRKERPYCALREGHRFYRGKHSTCANDDLLHVSRSFAEILYLDSDNIALTDPAFLFEHPVYQERGAVFWPDFHKEVRQALVSRMRHYRIN